ncbi:MAG: hypothetical protein RQ714_03860 [Nitrosomonas sp.]|nr:hypothetical protein [Nitrosomonas sp.]
MSSSRGGVIEAYLSTMKAERASQRHKVEVLPAVPAHLIMNNPPSPSMLSSIP